MSKKNIILFFLFFSLLSYKVVASDADQVNTDSEDFETTTIEDQIYDPFEPLNRAIFSFNNVADRIILEPMILETVFAASITCGYNNWHWSQPRGAYHILQSQ